MNDSRRFGYFFDDLTERFQELLPGAAVHDAGRVLEHPQTRCSRSPHQDHGDSRFFMRIVAWNHPSSRARHRPRLLGQEKTGLNQRLDRIEAMLAQALAPPDKPELARMV